MLGTPTHFEFPPTFLKNLAAMSKGFVRRALVCAISGLSQHVSIRGPELDRFRNRSAKTIIFSRCGSNVMKVIISRADSSFAGGSSIQP